MKYLSLRLNKLLVDIRKMPPIRDAHRGGLRGRVKGVRRNQPAEGQAEQNVPTTPVTHTNLVVSVHLK